MDIIHKTEIGKYVSVCVRYQVTWHASAALVEGGSEAMAGRERKVSGRRKRKRQGKQEAEAEAAGEAGGVPLTPSPLGSNT